MAVIIGNGRSTNYYSMVVSGNMKIKKGSYVSVWVYGSGDNSYYYQSESGFSCHRLLSKVGFRAELTSTLSRGTGWKVVSGPWRFSGEAGLYSVGVLASKDKAGAKKGPVNPNLTTKAAKKTAQKGFNKMTGKYYAPKPGVYYCSANFRLDNANVKGNFRMTLAHDNKVNTNGGSYIQTGVYFSTNYGTLQLSSTIQIKTFVAPWLYSSSDNSWQINSESGFGCHMLTTKFGFHADQATNRNYGRYWQQIRDWRITGNAELYGSSSLNANGLWTVPLSGYYFCSAAIRLDNKHYNSYSRLVISIDGYTGTNQGINTIIGNRGSYNTRFQTVAGVIRVQKGSTIGMKIYSSSDNSWTFRTESGFSCHMLGRADTTVLSKFEKRINNGFAVIEGNGGAHNQRTMGASGVMKMKRGDHASVFVYSNNDNSWQIQGESGFSCHKLSTTVGFHADKDGDSSMGTSWNEWRKWRVAGYPTLFSSGGGFNPKSGRYKVLAAGAYYCYAQLRLDDTSRNLYRVILSRNQEKDVNNGFHSIGGNYGSTNYRSMRLVGNAWFRKGDTVSLFTYSSSDSYTAQSESGFGCHKLATGFGFHADMSRDQGFGRGWRRVSYWRGGGNEFLYSSGGGFTADGYYYAPVTGYYICSANMRLDSAVRSNYFRLLLTINDNKDYNNGLHSINGYGSTNYRPMTVSGSVYMKEKQRMSLWIYSSNDNSWRAQHESGFGCHLLRTYAKC